MIVHVLVTGTRDYSQLYNKELGLVTIYALKLDTMPVDRALHLSFYVPLDILYIIVHNVS